MKDVHERSGEDERGDGDQQDTEEDEEADGDRDANSGHKDIHHDPWLIPASPDLQALAASIFDRLELSSPRPIRQRADATERRRAIVANVVASLALIVRHHAGGTRLAISAKRDAATRYDRRDFPARAFMQTVVEMEEAGLLFRRQGTRGQQRTTLTPSAKFRQSVASLEIRIGRLEGAETIILSASTGRAKPKTLIDYKDTPETIAMREDMGSVNAMLDDTYIKLGDDTPPAASFLTRRFQIEHPEAPHTFTMHGRLYGGFWLSLPKTERHRLRVNGEEVADLDFVALHPTLAYLEAGLALPNSDPYEIEGMPRAAAKIALSALLSRRGPMRRLPSDLRALVGKEWTAERITVAAAERHPGIAHLFGTGIGLRLMKTESDILVAALLDLFQQGVPALPMHDGIMVPASGEEAASRAMRRASMSVVGVALPVSKKEISKPTLVRTGGGPRGIETSGQR